MQPKTPPPAQAEPPARSSSQVWTRAESAAGCVLRYVPAMRGQLTELLGEEELADHAISLLLSHLAKKGYDGLANGRLRDFVLRGLRSAAKATLAEQAAERSTVDPNTIHSNSQVWLSHWRHCLLDTTWRSFEREEHLHPESIAYTALWQSKQHPKDTQELLAERVSREKQQQISVSELAEQLPRSRKRFAKLLAAQIASTLDNANTDTVRAEIAELGLTKYFSSS